MTLPPATGGVAPYSYELIDLAAGLRFTPGPGSSQAGPRR